MTTKVREPYLDNTKQHLPLKSLSVPAHSCLWRVSLLTYLSQKREMNTLSMYTGNGEVAEKPPSLPVLTVCCSFCSFTRLNSIHAAEAQRATAFHSLQLHPLKENDVPLEVGVCLAAREDGRFRASYWLEKWGLSQHISSQGSNPQQVAARSICCLREVIKNRMLTQLPYKQEIRRW